MRLAKHDKGLDRNPTSKGRCNNFRSVLLIGVVLLSFCEISVHGFSTLLNNKATIPKSQKKSNGLDSKDTFSPLMNIRSGENSPTVARAWPQTRDADPKGMPPDYPLTVGRIAVTIASVVLTWYAHASNKCSPILASAAVSLVFSLVSPGLGQASFCGTFAGMSSNVILVDGWGAAFSLGVLTSILFETIIHYRNFLLGIGGRLGFVAFIANNLLAFLRGNAIYSKSAAAAVSLPALACTSFYTGLGSVLTIALREASDDRPSSDPVRASAVIGLLAALLAGCHPWYTNASALAVYAGSFVGMSLPSRLLKGIIPNQPTPPPSSNKKPMSSMALLSIFALAGMLGGIYNVLLTNMGLWAVPAGWGGKAGSTSMLGVLTCRLLSKLIRQ